MTISSLQTKAMGALLLVMLIMMLVIGLSSMALIRDFSMRSATEHTRMAAEMIRVSLTEAMINDTIDRRASMLRRLAEVNSLNEVRVIRGEHVIRQYGEGLAMETSAAEVSPRNHAGSLVANTVRIADLMLFRVSSRMS
ncbi:hypothetical protein SAMN05421693_1561, partial [Ectothiorhodospira magna]